MKLLASLLLVLLASIVSAQKNMFVRVYDLAGKKIYKGDVYAAPDSALLLEINNKLVVVQVSNIGKIKTKHSVGNNLVIGSSIGVITLGIIGAATADPNAEIYPTTTAEGAASGALLGVGAGAVIGGITILFKNSKTFHVNGNMNQWKTFQAFIKPRSAGK